MRAAERDALADEQVGDVGRGDELVGRGVGHPLAVERRRRQHPPRRGEAELERVGRVEEVLLVLLQILVVGERQGVHDPEQRAVMGGDARRLRAQELGRVRVLLLRHDRRAARPRVAQGHEPELLARPQHDLGAEAAQVHRAGRRRAEVVEDEVAVGDGVDRVRRDAREAELGGDGPAVGREVHPGQRARAQREHRRRLDDEAHPRAVADEHPDVREQVMREVDGLGALQVRVAGQRPVDVALGDVHERRGERLHARGGGAGRVAREERDVGRHLVVARPRRVQLPARRPGELGDPPLDRHVDVLVVGEEREATLRELRLHRVERDEQRVAVGAGDDPGAGQHPRVGARLAHVVRPEAAVEAQRGVELPEDRVLGFGEPIMSVHAGLAVCRAATHCRPMT